MEEFMIAVSDKISFYKGPFRIIQEFPKVRVEIYKDEVLVASIYEGFIHEPKKIERVYDTIYNEEILKVWV